MLSAPVGFHHRTELLRGLEVGYEVLDPLWSSGVGEPPSASSEEVVGNEI
jgi:hypothetical protein